MPAGAKNLRGLSHQTDANWRMILHHHRNVWTLIVLMMSPLLICCRAVVSQVTTPQVSNAENLQSKADHSDLVDVFVPERDKYSHIRIPAIVTTNAGTIIAFAEGRNGGDHSENDIKEKALRRSRRRAYA